MRYVWRQHPSRILLFPRCMLVHVAAQKRPRWDWVTSRRHTSHFRVEGRQIESRRNRSSAQQTIPQPGLAQCQPAKRHRSRPSIAKGDRVIFILAPPRLEPSARDRELPTVLQPPWILVRRASLVTTYPGGQLAWAFRKNSPLLVAQGPDRNKWFDNVEVLASGRSASRRPTMSTSSSNTTSPTNVCRWKGTSGLRRGSTARKSDAVLKSCPAREIGMKRDAFYATILPFLLPLKAKGSSEAVP